MTAKDTDTLPTPTDASEAQVSRIRDRYAEAARRGRAGNASCCSSSGSTRFGYAGDELAAIPGAADLGLGCGAPIEQLDPQPGETVLDLGSGGGIDVFLAARRVGPHGRAIGVDMTTEMIELARANAASAGLDTVEFRHGRLEALPLDDASVDAVTSNCVINLVPDKRAVFAEIARVLRPGGRVVVSDIVLERPLPPALLREMNEANCIVTAITRDEYLSAVRESGLLGPEILRDVDYLATAGWEDEGAATDESRDLLERAGVAYDDVAGTVRSITWRAVKP